MDLADVKERARLILRDVARIRSTITYRELREWLDPALPADALAPLLREISTEEATAGRGMLTAVVVRASGSRLPGGGFFRLAADLGRDVDDPLEFWTQEIARVYAASTQV